MIVGKGFIANQLIEYDKNKKIIIFASGVSNSKENDNDKFLKEINLIKTFSKKKALFIYFSSCCVNDSIAKNSLYAKHKLLIEKEIINSFKNYLILRLPNVIGINKNKNTFFNFFYNAIINDQKLIIHKDSIRYFIDIADLNDILKMFIELRITNRIIDIAFKNPVKVLKCLRILENCIGKKANYSIVEKSASINLSLDFFNEKYETFYNKKIGSNYTRKCFEKYVNMKLLINNN